MACENCQKSISEDEVSDCISEKVDEGWDRERAVAACLSMAEEGSTEPDSIDGVEFLARLFDSDKETIQASVEDVDTTPTEEMADIASEVLEKIDDTEFNNDDCGTRTGLERANQLENQEELSADTVGRMVSFFARHDGNQSVDDDVDSKWEDCGFVAWQLWGGDPGRDWAERKQEEIEEAEEDPEKEVNDTMDSKQELKQNIEEQDRENIQQKSFTVKGEDVEVVKQDSESEPVVNIPIQALTEDRDGDIINEKGQESIVRQLKSGTVPLVPNHGVGQSDAHYGFEDIFGQFVDGENRNGTTIGTARLLEGNEFSDKLIELLENDMPVGFSVGFRVLEGDERKEEGGMEIEKVDLMEVSAVGIPSNPEAVPQAMGSAVAMAKNAGLNENEIVDSIKKAFNDTMSENTKDKDGTEQKEDSKSEEQNLKQMTEEDIDAVMGTIGGAIDAHMDEAMEQIQDDLMAMADGDEEEPDETEVTDEDEEDDEDEEEMSSEPEEQDDASDHTEDSEKDESAESADEKSEETDEDLQMPENGKQGGKIKEASESSESEEKSEENETEDPFKVRSL